MEQNKGLGTKINMWKFKKKKEVLIQIKNCVCKKLKNCYAKISKIHHLNAKINRWSKKFKQWPVVEDEGNKAVSYFLRVNQPCTKKSQKKLGHRVNHSCTKSLKRWDIAKSQTAKLRKIAHFITSLRKVRHREKSKRQKLRKLHTSLHSSDIPKNTVTQSLRNRGGNITESHTESQYKLEKALRGSEIQKSAIEPLRKMR